VPRYDGPGAWAGAEAGDRVCSDKRPDTTTPHRRPPIAPDAATAAGWGDRPPPHRTALRRWRPLHRVTLRGFADIELPNGLRIDDIAVHVRDGRIWASLPTRPMLDQDGRHVFSDGKPQYAPILRSQSRPRRPILGCGGRAGAARASGRTPRGGTMNACGEKIARAFGLRRAGRRNYTGKCPSCGYGSGFTVTERGGATLLYCHAGGCSQPELWGALETAGLATRKSPRETVERKRQPATCPDDATQTGELSTRGVKRLRAPEDLSKGEEAAFAIWRRSRPARDTIAGAYLGQARGYTGPIPVALRFALGRHPSDAGRWHPMMVAAVARHGRIVAVHRTFLRADGRGKSDLDPNKMTLGACRGGAVPLAPAGPMLAVAEGIETALSFMQATAVPTWAALSAGGIRNLILPEIVREVVIAADPDPVGLIAARAAARRWLAEGRSVRIARPPLNSDFNDLLRAGS
jgi:hypothetical protein